ncbi:MAG TPA: hypothetical protein VM390_00045 [Acidimicrobiales bacterium]|jgi:hypothetical protein|nr:hypothetical protein [Acidimicrobiales bacterium]
MAEPRAVLLSIPGVRALTASGATVAAVLFATSLSSTASLTRPATMLVIGAGVVLGATWFVSQPATIVDTAPVATAGVAVWVILVAAFCGWEVAAFALGDDYEHPTFSKLADPVLERPPVRALAALGWVAWGRRLGALAAEGARVREASR